MVLGKFGVGQVAAWLRILFNSYWRGCQPDLAAGAGSPWHLVVIFCRPTAVLLVAGKVFYDVLPLKIQKSPLAKGGL